MAEYKKIEDGKVELTCTVDGDKWAEAKKKAFAKLSKDLQIKGFRKGQVPASLAKKYVSDNQTWLEAASSVADETFSAALKEHDVELIDQASMDLKEINENQVVMVFACPVKPDVKLGDYKSLKYEVAESVVTDEEVENDIKAVLDRKADLELKEDGAVEMGDTAVIDFEGFKDGVAFEGGKAENYELGIGSGSFIPGFEEQVVGMKAEETKEINVQFPENYHAEDLKGAPVVFKVTVHEIKKRVLPELNDEFVKELKIENVNTVEEYKNHIKETKLAGKKNQAENEAQTKLLEEFAKMCEVNIPAKMIEREVDQQIQEQAQRLAYQGLKFDQYLQFTNQTMDEVRKNLVAPSTERVKVSLCLEALAKEANVEVSEEDIEKYYDDMASTYGMPKEDVKKYVDVETVKGDLKLNKALELLKNN
ncbi:MAG: trigger factor [Erysipelotrichaceae bacterium]|nr:trigger factor [Erysipelotrichaceae bacterium]